MVGARPISTLFAGHFKLTLRQCPQPPREEEEKYRVLYASTVGSLMYAMVCPSLNAVSMVSWYVKSGKITLEISGMDIRISTRDCGARLGISKS